MATTETKIIQSYKLYRATGMVDKEKRIYYVPTSQQMITKAQSVTPKLLNNEAYYR